MLTVDDVYLCTLNPESPGHALLTFVPFYSTILLLKFNFVDLFSVRFQGYLVPTIHSVLLNKEGSLK